MLNMVSEEKVTTIQSINVFGEVTAITQSGFKADGTTPISQTEYRAYDANHNLCKVTRSDVGSTVINNSVLGEVQWQAQGVTSTTTGDCVATFDDEQKVEFIYDNLGGVRKVNYRDSITPDLVYTLDNNGNLKTLAADTVSQSYNYNSLDFLKDESMTITGDEPLTLDYTYDNQGSVSSITYPDGDVVSFAPNGFGEPTQSVRGARTGRAALNYATSARYYPNGSIDTFTYGNDLVHKTTLNSRKVPSSIVDGVTNGATALSYDYTYDNNLNVKSLIDNIDNSDDFSLTSLTYDGLDRLKTTTGGTGIGSSSINYDGLGNITAYSNTGHLTAGKNRNLDYSYDLNNRLDEVQIPGSTPIKIRDMAYDDRGNVTDNSMLGFTYNRANQMVSASGGNKTFLYDGHNRRVRKTSVTADGTETSYSLYSQSGTLLYRETDEGGINYIYLGKKLIAKDGVIPENSSKQHYRPFGESIEGAIDDAGYTGHKFDTDLGLSYMQARYYDPVIGRFYGNDPVGYTAKNPVMSFNRYLYVNNNPYKYTDPDGEFINFGLGGFGAVVGGISGGVAAFLSSDGDLEKTLKGAGSGAAFGFITGATFGLAGAGTITGTQIVRQMATGFVTGSGGDVAGQLVGNGGDLAKVDGGQAAIAGLTGTATSGLTTMAKVVGFTPKQVLTTGAVASGAMAPAKSKTSVGSKMTKRTLGTRIRKRKK
jgi:RHS repeat-associated protein